MSKEEIITILATTLGSGTMVAVISYFQNRRKTGAETHNLNISGEINIGEAWQKYAMQMAEDMRKMQTEMAQLRVDFEKIKSEKEDLADATVKKDKIIKDLQERVAVLEKQLEIYEKK